MDNAELFAGLLAALTDSWQGLPDKPEETPETTLKALWRTAANDRCCAARASQAALPPLSEAQLEQLQELVAKRTSGCPLAYLTGRQQFMGIEMLAGPEALIPRKETEILGYASLEKLTQLLEERGSATVIDVCTGAGNIVLALAHHEPGARYMASDLSPEATSLARRNAKHLGIEGRVEFRVGDLFGPFSSEEFIGQVDMITCNPPYISTNNVGDMPDEISKHEPPMAFDGGPFGVAVLSRLIREATRFLKPNSWLCFEVGRGQGEPLMSRLSEAGKFRAVQGVSDASEEVRALLART
jgi:release factor glutamine methyltransferase